MTGLTALNPFFLSLLPLAALPVIFHLFFRLKKQPRPFPTLMFFHRIDPKLNARRRLREWLILLLRTLLIGLVLLALAHPVWFGVGHEGSLAVVLVLDNSGSMSGKAANGEPKFKLALSAARNLIAQLRPGDVAALVPLVSDPATLLPAGLTSDTAALKDALEHLTETEASASVAAALERAVALLEGNPASHCEIHVLSDLQEEKWNQAPLELRAPRRGTGIVVHRIPSARAETANVSLAGAQVPARSILSGRRLPLEARLLNQSAIEARVRLNWADDAGGRGGEEIIVPPQAEKTATLSLEPQNPGFRWVNVWLEGDDFPAANRACTGFFCSEKRAVTFAGNAADFGQLPLAVSPSSEGKLSGLVPAFVDVLAFASHLDVQSSALVVMTWEDATRGASESASRWTALRQFLNAGGTVLLVPSTSPGAFGPFPDWLSAAPGALQGAPAGLALTVLDKLHPLFNDLRDDKGEVALHNLRAVKFYALRNAPTNTAILGLEDGRVLLAEQKLGRGRLLASGIAFDSRWSTLPLKPGFVALAQNLALAATAAATNVLALVAGDPLRLAAPPNAPLRVQSLAGSPLDWKGLPAELHTLPRAGVYAVRHANDTTYVAVRSSEKEGRQKFLATDSLPALGKLSYAVKGLESGEALVSEFRKMQKSLDLSWLLLLAAFAALGAEGWLANPLPMQAARPKPQPAPVANAMTTPT